MMFRTFSDRTTILQVSKTGGTCPCDGHQTFIFAYVFQRKCKTGIFAFDNAYFAKGTFAYDSEKLEMV